MQQQHKWLKDALSVLWFCEVQRVIPSKRGQVDSTQWQVTLKDDSFSTSLRQGSLLPSPFAFLFSTLGLALQSHKTRHV